MKSVEILANDRARALIGEEPDLDKKYVMAWSLVSVHRAFAEGNLPESDFDVSMHVRLVQGLVSNKERLIAILSGSRFDDW